jgi:hypothetical protein
MEKPSELFLLQRGWCTVVNNGEAVNMNYQLYIDGAAQKQREFVALAEYHNECYVYRMRHKRFTVEQVNAFRRRAFRAEKRALRNAEKWKRIGWILHETMRTRNAFNRALYSVRLRLAGLGAPSVSMG